MSLTSNYSNATIQMNNTIFTSHFLKSKGSIQSFYTRYSSFIILSDMTVKPILSVMAASQSSNAAAAVAVAGNIHF